MVSGEHQVSEPGSFPAANDQFSPAIAWSGAAYFAVWVDNRGGEADIYGARLDAAGVLLDQTGIAIAAAPGIQYAPRVDWDGTNFFIVWEDFRGGIAKIFGARVSAAGVLLDPAGIAIDPLSPGPQHFPTAVWNGTEHLVVWEDARSGGRDIYGARVAATGTVLDQASFLIGPTAGNRNPPALASDGTDWLVVWEDRRTDAGNIYGARVSVAGTVLDSGGFAISTAPGAQRTPTVAWNGTHYFAVWEDGRCPTPGCSDLYGARIGAAGTVQDPLGIAISTAERTQGLPALGWDGTNFLVVWWDFRTGKSLDIFGARVSPAGAVLEPEGLSISVADESQFAPALAWSGSSYFVVWEDDRCGGIECADIYGARVGATGVVDDGQGIPISLSAGSQTFSSVASDGTSYLVVWEDARSGALDVYGARISADGSSLDPDGIPISTAPGAQRHPSVVWDGANYLVAWEEEPCGSAVCADIYGARVSASGTVLDPAGIPISTAPQDQVAPRLAAGNGQSLVVWLDARATLHTYAARVTQAGTVLDPDGIDVSVTADGQGASTVASDGTNFLVAWGAYGGSSNYDIRGARLDASGVPLDQSPIAITSAPNGQSGPAASWNGSSYLVVWEDFRSGRNYDIYGARVSTAGGVLDTAGIPVAVGGAEEFGPALAWDGECTLVLWEDTRSLRSVDVYGARVSAAGTVEPANGRGFALSAALDDERSPAAVGGPAGRAAVVYGKFDTEDGYRSERTLLRFYDVCVQEGAAIGAICPFSLASPPDGTSLRTSGSPPNFLWGNGAQFRFRVEFSGHPDFAKPRVWSGSSFKLGALFTPTDRVWRLIGKLAPQGSPIYWRVLGKAKRSNRITPSEQVFSFTIEP